MSKKELFQERDLSWLSFNYRVLQEAKDPTVPLYERLKFLAIYSSNLDEFFRVRVASLRSFRKLEKATRREMELRPRRLLKEIRRIVQAQQAEFGEIFREEILPELARHQVFLVNEGKLGAAQRKFAKQF
ncbi:MAG: polyphosphate kinase 1, partial [Bacteroidota bacterium]